MPNSDPCHIITPLVLVGLGLGVGEGLGLGNHIAISTRGVIIWQGVENGHNTGFTHRHSRHVHNYFFYLTLTYIYIYSRVMFHFLFYFFAVSIERTCPDLHFTTDYTLYDCVCVK